MEKLKTRNEYVGCNRNCRFYGDTLEATSYKWWTFTKVINGKLVFNDGYYSSTTSGHQWAIRGLLYDLGVKVDHYVYMNDSLTEESFKKEALYHHYNLAIKMIVQNNTNRVRKATKESNTEAIAMQKGIIKELRELGAEFPLRRIVRLYREYKKQRDNKEEFLKAKKKFKNRIFRDEKGTRYIVDEFVTRDERIRLRSLEKNNTYKDVYYPYFNNQFTYCNLSNALEGHKELAE